VKRMTLSFTPTVIVLIRAVLLLDIMIFSPAIFGLFVKYYDAYRQRNIAVDSVKAIRVILWEFHSPEESDKLYQAEFTGFTAEFEL